MTAEAAGCCQVCGEGWTGSDDYIKRVLEAHPCRVVSCACGFRASGSLPAAVDAVRVAHENGHLAGIAQAQAATPRAANDRDVRATLREAEHRAHGQGAAALAGACVQGLKEDGYPAGISRLFARQSVMGVHGLSWSAADRLVLDAFRDRWLDGIEASGEVSEPAAPATPQKRRASAR